MRFPLRCRVDGSGLWASCRPQYSAGAMDGSRYRRAVGVDIRRACVELCWWSGGEGESVEVSDIDLEQRFPFVGMAAPSILDDEERSYLVQRELPA